MQILTDLPSPPPALEELAVMMEEHRELQHVHKTQHLEECCLDPYAYLAPQPVQISASTMSDMETILELFGIDSAGDDAESAVRAEEEEDEEDDCMFLAPLPKRKRAGKMSPSDMRKTIRQLSKDRRLVRSTHRN